jgi:TolB-like protein/predicted Ser/Thr protein kinase
VTGPPEPSAGPEPPGHTAPATDEPAESKKLSGASKDLTGSMVQHYAVAERLGEGGMGVVYRAEDTRLHRAVALKFPSEAMKDTKNRERLFREARAASALASPNIVSIYEIGEFEDSPFIAMEYVEGQRLCDRLKDGPIPLDEALDIVVQVAGALESAHAAGVIHRDIKSSNLVVMESGVVKVLDFGIAKFVHQETSAPEAATSTITVSGNVFGTLSYMSPEQALGRPVDHRSDLFSLGVVFYQTLTGQLPFAGSSLNEVLDHIVHHEPMPVARFNYEVPADVEAVLRKMLEKDLNLRYQHAKDIQIDLQRIIRDRHPQDASAAARAASDPATGSLGAVGFELSATRALVMDFRNLTGNGTVDGLGVSLTETVTADVNRTLGFDIIGREAVSELRRLAGPVAPGAAVAEDTLALEWARRARAGWLITGAYQRFGDTVRITAKLIDAREGAVVQSVKIDGEAHEMLAMQDRIVPELTASLNRVPDDKPSTSAEAVTRERTAGTHSQGGP